MENKNYLNEEQYQKNKKKINMIGNILLSIGALLIVAGAISLVLDNYIGGIPISVGVALLGVGLQAKLIANGREINAFLAQQQMPVEKEKIEKIAPSVGVAAEEITKGVKEGLKDEDK